MQAVVEQVQILIRNHPKSFLLWNISGAANAQLGRLEQAINDFRNASNLNPNYPDAHNNSGITLKKQGKIGEAVNSYKRALILDPSSAEAHNNLGVALQEQGKINQAIGLVTLLFRSLSSFRRPFVRKPRGFSHPAMNVADAGYRTR